MATFIQDLIARMSDDTYRPGEVKVAGTYESEKTVSAKAHTDARLLSNPDVMEELMSIIDKTQDIDTKRSAYFILGYNAKNTGDKNATAYLLKRLSKEKDSAVLVIMLDRLAELYKPADLDTAQIYKLTTHRNGDVRGSAFEALTNNENKVEDFLIDKLQTTDKKDDISPLLSALMYVGTPKSIPHVEKQLKNRQVFIKDFAVDVLIVIMLREKFSFEEIQKKLKVPAGSVQRLFERLEIVTRPG